MRVDADAAGSRLCPPKLERGGAVDMPPPRPYVELVWPEDAIPRPRPYVDDCPYP